MVDDDEDSSSQGRKIDFDGDFTDEIIGTVIF